MSGCAPELVHATCVAVGRVGVLLRGPPGSGKSDLALRLVLLPPPCGAASQLVADDQVLVHNSAGRLLARAPVEIAGRIEVRGLGIVEVPSVPEAAVELAVDLVPLADVPRMPLAAETVTIQGVAVRRLALYAFEASAPLKVLLALGRGAPAS